MSLNNSVETLVSMYISLEDEHEQLTIVAEEVAELGCKVGRTDTEEYRLMEVSRNIKDLLKQYMLKKAKEMNNNAINKLIYNLWI